MAADDFTLPTSVPHDDAGLRATAEAIRATLSTTDPRSMYFGRPDAAAAAEANVKAAFLRAGVSERPTTTPEQLAASQHDAAFRLRDMPAGLVSTIEERAAAVVARGNVDQQAQALRAQVGDAAYDELVADARHARPELAGVAGDLHALKMLANHGRYLAAYARTKPGKS
jgi:hypothetical protein